MLRRTEGNEDGKKFSRSKYELPWRLRNESLAQDPMKVAAHIAPNAINAAGERPLKPELALYGKRRWNVPVALNQSVHVGAKRTTPPAGPAGGAPRHSRGQIPESPNKSDRKAFSRTVCATIGVPSGCALLRISQNVYPCMGLTAARTSAPTKRIACHAPDTITGQDGHRQNAGAEDARSGQRRADVPPRSTPLSSGKRRGCGRATDSDANRPEATCRRCGTRFE